MTDAGQRLIEDLRNPDVHFAWYDRLAAAKEIERLRGVEAVAIQLNNALTQNQWGFNHRRCCLCAGFDKRGNGETDHRHTDDCPVNVALKAYAASRSTGAADAGEER